MHTQFNVQICIPGQAVNTDKDITVDINVTSDASEKEFIALTKSQRKIAKVFAPVFGKFMEFINTAMDKLNK